MLCCNFWRDFWVTLLLILLPLQSFSNGEGDIHCRMAECSDQIQEKISQGAPALLLDSLPIIAQMQKGLLEAGNFEEVLQAELAKKELIAAVKACEEFVGRLPNIRYKNLDDLLAMCSEPAVKELRKQYEGFSLPFTDKYDRKTKAREEYEGALAGLFSNLLLSKQAVLLIQLSLLQKSPTLSGTLEPKLEDCSNHTKGKFQYPYSGQSASFENFRKSLALASLQSLITTQDLDRAMVERHLKENRETLNNLCQGSNFAGTMTAYVNDPMAATLLFNQPDENKDTSTMKQHKVTFCRYYDTKEKIKVAQKKMESALDLTTMLESFVPVAGNAMSTLHNVSYYGAKLGLLYKIAEEQARKYEAGVAGADPVVDAQNAAAEGLMETTLVGVGEALGWALPVAGVILGKRLLKLLKAGELGEWIKKGLVRLVGNRLHFEGKWFDLSALPESAMSQLRKVLLFVSHLDFAKVARINISSYVAIIEDVTKRYGAEVAAKLEAAILKGGRKAFDKIGCKGFLVIGAAGAHLAL